MKDDVVSLLISLSINTKLLLHEHNKAEREKISNRIFKINQVIEEKFKKGLTEEEIDDLIDFLLFLFMSK